MPSWYPQRQVNYQILLSDPILIFLLHRNPFNGRCTKSHSLHLRMLYCNNNERTENKAVNMAYTEAGLGIWPRDRVSIELYSICQRERGVPLGRAGRRCLIMRTDLHLVFFSLCLSCVNKWMICTLEQFNLSSLLQGVKGRKTVIVPILWCLLFRKHNSQTIFSVVFG